MPNEYNVKHAFTHNQQGNGFSSRTQRFSSSQKRKHRVYGSWPDSCFPAENLYNYRKPYKFMAVKKKENAITGGLQCEANHLKGQLTIKPLIQKRLKTNRNPSMVVLLGIPALGKLRQESCQVLSQPGLHRETSSQKTQNHLSSTSLEGLLLLYFDVLYPRRPYTETIRTHLLWHWRHCEAFGWWVLHCQEELFWGTLETLPRD